MATHAPTSNTPPAPLGSVVRNVVKLKLASSEVTSASSIAPADHQSDIIAPANQCSHFIRHSHRQGWSCCCGPDRKYLLLLVCKRQLVQSQLQYLHQARRGRTVAMFSWPAITSTQVSQVSCHNNTVFTAVLISIPKCTFAWQQRHSLAFFMLLIYCTF